MPENQDNQEILPPHNDSVEKIIESWQRTESDFKILEDNIDQIHQYAIDFGEFQEDEHAPRYVFTEPSTMPALNDQVAMGMSVEAMDVDRTQAESFEYLKGQFLSITDNSSTRSVEIAFFVDDDELLEIQTSASFKDPDPRHDDPIGDLVVFSRRPIHFLSDGELKVVTGITQKFVDRYVTKPQTQS